MLTIENLKDFTENSQQSSGRPGTKIYDFLTPHPIISPLEQAISL